MSVAMLVTVSGAGRFLVFARLLTRDHLAVLFKAKAAIRILMNMERVIAVRQAMQIRGDRHPVTAIFKSDVSNGCTDAFGREFMDLDDLFVGNGAATSDHGEQGSRRDDLTQFQDVTLCYCDFRRPTMA